MAHHSSSCWSIMDSLYIKVPFGMLCVCNMVGTLSNRGGFPSIQHSEIRNITSEFWQRYVVELALNPAYSLWQVKRLVQRSANREDGARLDIVAENFWGHDRQRAFFDVQVLNPFAPCYHSTSLTQCYRRNKLEKRRAYDERIKEVEHGSFSPFVFFNSWRYGCYSKCSV